MGSSAAPVCSSQAVLLISAEQNRAGDKAQLLCYVGSTCSIQHLDGPAQNANKPAALGAIDSEGKKKTTVSFNASVSEILAATEHHQSTAGVAPQLAVGLQGQRRGQRGPQWQLGRAE